MTKPKLTIHGVRTMPFGDLVQTADELVAAYDPPEGGEDMNERLERLTKTLDEMPGIYRFFLTAQSLMDHHTDAMADQYGRSDPAYKAARQRRDAMERAASAAKSRYTGASRIITVIKGDDPSEMPRGRA